MKVFQVMRSLIILVVLVVGFYFVASSITKYTGFGVADHEEIFNDCLRGREIVLYVENYNDPILENLNTVKYLGSITVFECMFNENLCIKEGILEYPTWVRGNNKIVGDISVDELEKFSEC